MKRLLALLLFFSFALPASAAMPKRERDFYEPFANFFLKKDESKLYNPRLPDGSRADILTGSYIFEVEWSSHWHEGIGQALHYGLQAKNRKAGLVLILRKDKDEHFVKQALTIIEHYKLPIEVWTINAKHEVKKVR